MVLQKRSGSPHQIVRAVAQRINEAYARLQRQDGFVGATLVIDEDEGVLISNTMWQTYADMERSREHEQHQEDISTIITLVKGPPEIRQCRLHTMT